MPATLLIKPWNDPVVDTLGHDPRSRYVETFWLPTLGPTALLLLRHLADRFDRTPDGVELTVSDTSHALGLGQREGTSVAARPHAAPTRPSSTSRAKTRCPTPSRCGATCRRSTRATSGGCRATLQLAHAEWAEAQLAEPPLAEARRRSRRVAFTLLEQGDDPDHVERALHAIGFHPALCHESARWAYQRHCEALEHVHGRRVVTR